MPRTLIILALLLTACGEIPKPTIHRVSCDRLEEVIKQHGGANSAVMCDMIPLGIRSKPTWILRYTTERPLVNEAWLLIDLLDQFDLKHKYDRYLVLHNPEENTKHVLNLKMAYLCSKMPIRRRYACLQKIEE